MFRIYRALLFQVFAPLAAALVAPGPTRAHAQLRVRETALSARIADSIAGTFTFGRALDVAYIQKVAAGERVVVNGMAGKTFTSIPRVRLSEAGRVSSISFSPNGKRVAYVAAVDNKFAMVVDGVVGALYDFIPVGSAYFSPDSRRVTYIAKLGDRYFMITDGRASVPYNAIDVRHATFTTDNKHVVYTATSGDRHVVVFDGKEVGRAEYIGSPVLSKARDRLAYVQMNNDAWSVVVDGVAGKTYRSIGNNLIFSEDGKHLLYRGRDSVDHVVLDGVERGSAPSIRENSYDLSADGTHVAFIAQTAGHEHWVLDGVAQNDYDWVSGDAKFSADGGKLAYAAELDRKRFAVIGGREGERFDDISDFPQFGANTHAWYVGKRGAQQFAVIDGALSAYDQVNDVFVLPLGGFVVVGRLGAKWSVYVDGKSGVLYDDPPNSLLMSADGKHLAFLGGRGGKRLVSVDGKESELYDDVRALTMSPDGKHVAFVATRAQSEVVVLDGVPSASYDSVLWLDGSRQSDARSFSFLATRGSSVVRGDVNWSAAALAR